jgi:D-alanyl-D-alanine carboxypeptidase
VAVLQHVGVEGELTKSLPVAGVSGTLTAELVGGPAEGLMAAKTGTLTGVRALSGFLPADDGVMSFALVLNGAEVDQPAYYQPLWSRLVTLLDGYPIGPDADDFAPR